MLPALHAVRYCHSYCYYAAVPKHCSPAAVLVLHLGVERPVAVSELAEQATQCRSGFGAFEMLTASFESEMLFARHYDLVSEEIISACCNS